MLVSRNFSPASTLRAQAEELGANTVAGLSMQYDQFVNSGLAYIVATAQGTAMGTATRN